MAGGDDQLCGVIGIGCAERAWLALDAGIELAIGGVENELEDVTMRDVGIGESFRRGRMRWANNEIAVFISGRNCAVGKLRGVHVAGCVRIARRWSRAGLRRRGWLIWCGLRRRRNGWSLRVRQ